MTERHKGSGGFSSWNSVGVFTNDCSHCTTGSQKKELHSKILSVTIGSIYKRCKITKKKNPLDKTTKWIRCSFSIYFKFTEILLMLPGEPKLGPGMKTWDVAPTAAGVLPSLLLSLVRNPRILLNAPELNKIISVLVANQRKAVRWWNKAEDAFTFLEVIKQKVSFSLKGLKRRREHTASGKWKPHSLRQSLCSFLPGSLGQKGAVP